MMALEPDGVAVSRPEWQRRAELWAQWLAVFLPVAVVLPTAWVSITQVLLLVLWPLTGNLAGRIERIRRNPIALVATALFSLVLVGTLYSSADWSESLDTADNYLALLLIPVIVSLFDKPIWQQRAVRAIAIGVMVIMAVAYSRWIGLLPSATGVSMAFKSHITEGIMLSLGFFVFLHLGFRSSGSKTYWWLAAALVLPLLFFFYGGKTGYVVFFALALLFAWQRFGLRATVPAIAGMLAMVVVLWSTSSVFQQRIADGLEGIDSPIEGGVEQSIGLRLEYYRNTLEVILERPLFGVGTGGFLEAYRSAAADADAPPAIITDDPHNEYLLLAAQLGIPGLLAFILLLGQQWHKSFRLEQPYNFLAQGLVLAMAVSCLFNSSLMDFTEGVWFSGLSGILFAGLAVAGGDKEHSEQVESAIHRE